MQLGQWIQKNTFTHLNYSNVKHLIQQKEKRGVKISLCLPSRNEEETIGQVIRTLRKPLMLQNSLLDEIIVVDSESTDRTRDIARKEGATVYLDREILPELGNHRGKGENLWKSLVVSNGDLIVWLDTDIKNMHPRFVTGLIGPLLFHPEISFVKGFYRRPLKVGAKLQKSGGGRVTEILVRPFINLLFPNLAGFYQPLSGEYAGRRELLERIPFFTGYGVETGMLIDIENRFGLGCMAQSDLDVRIHRNQDLTGLRKMAFGISQVLLTRAEQHGKLLLMNNLPAELLAPFKDGFEENHLQVDEIREFERPPILRCTEYQKKRGYAEDDLILHDIYSRPNSGALIAASPLLDNRLIILNGKARNKKEVLEEIGVLLHHSGMVNSLEQLLYNWQHRENILSTGIGSGVAIPHDISENINTMKIAVYLPENGIPFDSLDGQPVDMIFTVIAPQARRPFYLHVLASLATMLRSESIRNNLRKAETPDEFIQLFRKSEAMQHIKKELELFEQ
ncbi:MAG: hypothetical protein Kow0037_11920 [Calditrichia bacterium]